MFLSRTLSGLLECGGYYFGERSRQRGDSHKWQVLVESRDFAGIELETQRPNMIDDSRSLLVSHYDGGGWDRLGLIRQKIALKTISARTF
jgi:hypothetical protein